MQHNNKNNNGSNSKTFCNSCVAVACGAMQNRSSVMATTFSLQCRMYAHIYTNIFVCVCGCRQAYLLLRLLHATQRMSHATERGVCKVLQAAQVQLSSHTHAHTYCCVYVRVSVEYLYGDMHRMPSVSASIRPSVRPTDTLACKA